MYASQALVRVGPLTWGGRSCLQAHEREGPQAGIRTAVSGLLYGAGCQCTIGPDKKVSRVETYGKSMDSVSDAECLVQVYGK